MKIPYFFFLESYLEKTKHDIAKGLKLTDTIACIMGLAGTVLCIIEHEIYINGALDYQEIVDSEGGTETVELYIYPHYEPAESTTLRTIISITTLITIIAVLKRYMIRWKYIKLKATLDIRTKARKTLHFWFCCIEVLYLLIHAPPKLNFEISWDEQGKDVRYPFDTLVSIIILGRVYLIWRVFHNFSFWNNANSNQIKETFGCAIKARFALKAEMKFRPYQIVSWAVIVSVVILGFALRNAEIVNLAVSRLDWYPFWNGMWCVAMTMTAVGYGDYYPTTGIGRFIILLAALWGNFLTSIFVVALTNSIEFTFNQNQSYQMVKRGQKEIVLATKAANLLKFAILLWIRNGKKVHAIYRGPGITTKLLMPGIFSRKRPHISVDHLKKLYIQSAIEFKKYRKDHEASLNEVSTDSVYREVKSVLLKDLTYLKAKLPLYSNINKRIIENELFQILIQEKIESLTKTQKNVFKKLGNPKSSGAQFTTFENRTSNNKDEEESLSESDTSISPLRKVPNTNAFGLKDELDDSKSPTDNDQSPLIEEENIKMLEQKNNRKNWRGLKRFSVGDPVSLIDKFRKQKMTIRLQGIKDGKRVYDLHKNSSNDAPINQEVIERKMVKQNTQPSLKRKKIGSAIMDGMDQSNKTIKEAPLRGLIPGLADIKDLASPMNNTPINKFDFQVKDRNEKGISSTTETHSKPINGSITGIKPNQYMNPKPNKVTRQGSAWKPLGISQSRKRLAGISEIIMIPNNTEDRENGRYTTQSENSELLYDSETLMYKEKSSSQEAVNTKRSSSSQSESRNESK